MGYDIERFLGSVNDGLLCCICNDVLEHPLQAPCEHTFCGVCIRGWLSQQSNCPVDRQALTATNLRKLHRYMRNDLSRLQIRCRNQRSGCEMVCSLESIDKHDRECEFSHMSCINHGCTVQFQRRHLAVHLAVCEHQRRECTNGCGYTTLSAKDVQHSCIAELRTGLEILRSEMLCRIEKTKKEMKSGLDSQRQHKESLLQAQREIKELKSQMSRLLSDVETLKTSERKRRQDLERANQEKQANRDQQELVERLKGLQQERGTKSKDETHSPASSHSLPVVETLGRKTKEFTVS
ncbi:RING finger protein 151-like [Dendropsophus ebraccatus]|uniref:RING finger protein 151-like n=1 Tax=Dendropsophus ebraccatus TaxID=150705 RepID=UPI003831D7F6